MKKFLSILVVMCMLFTMFSTIVTASADEKALYGEDGLKVNEKYSPSFEKFKKDIKNNSMDFSKSKSLSGITAENVTVPSVGAYSGTCGESVTWSLSDSGVLTISGSGYMDDYSLDEGIYTPWIDYSESITSVVVKNGVESIGDEAFGNLENLTSVSLPETIQIMGMAAFYGCASLENVTIPSSVWAIGPIMFYGCASLKSVRIPKDVFYVGPALTAFCISLESITVDSGNEYYSSAGNCLIDLETQTIIAGCNNSEIPNNSSVTAVGEYAFWGILGITELYIPKYITSIDATSFVGCAGITSVTVDASNSTYASKGNCLIHKGDKVLVFGCMESTIPSDGSVVTIGDYAFCACLGLGTIDIPDSVTKIGAGAFSECYFLEIVYFSENLKDIGEGAFYDCTALLTPVLPASLERIGSFAFAYCENITSALLSINVQGVGECAFYGCYNMTDVVVISSVTTFGSQAFGYYGDDYGEDVKIEDFIIYGAELSYIQKYANNNGFDFIPFSFTWYLGSIFYLDREEKTMPYLIEGASLEDVNYTLAYEGMKLTAKDKNGVSLSDDSILGTGCVVADELDNSYTVIVRGDVDGNGRVNSTDYLQIKKVFLDELTLEGAFSAAADTNNDGIINSTDYLQIKNHFLGELDLYA